MLTAVEPIYKTLFDTINGLGELTTFEKGFWYKEDCTQRLDRFPYGFLHQPVTGRTQFVASPRVHQYHVEILLVILTYGADNAELFFGANGAVEIALRIANRMNDIYGYGLPFNPPLDGPQVLNWWVEDLDEAKMAELSEYFENPRFAGAQIPFIFEVEESTPLPTGDQVF